MTEQKHPASVAATATIQQASRRMRDINSDSLTVYDTDYQALGSVSAHDIVTQATSSGDDPKTTPIAMVMTVANDDASESDHHWHDRVELTRYGHAPDQFEPYLSGDER